MPSLRQRPMFRGPGLRSRTAFSASVPDSTLLTDLTSAWLLEDLTDSQGTNDLTNNNGVTFVAPGGTPPANMPGTVANFAAASSQWLSVADNPTTVWGEAGNGASFSFWFHPSANPLGFGLLFGRNAAGAADRTLEFLTGSGTLANAFVSVFAGTGGQNSANPGFVAGTWSHVIVTFNPADKMARFYVDNVLKATTAATSSSSISATATAVAIGGWPAVGGFINGQMSGLFVADRLWTDAERGCLYNGGDGGFWPFTGLCLP